MRPTYFDLPAKFSNYETAQVAILPIPLDVTTSYKGGTGKSPAAVLSASSQVELFDEELGFEPCSVGVASLKPLDIGGQKIEKAMERIKTFVADIISDGKLPVIIGGEHSVTPPAVAAAAKFYKSFTVVQLDAHADLRQEYGGTKWSHACAMARTMEITDVVGVGIRNISAEEARFVSKKKYPLFFAHKIKTDKSWIKKVLAAVKTKSVYLTIDVDVFDSSIMPDTGTPEPGGLNWYEVTDLIKALANQKNIIGFDIVELSPQKGHHASDFLVAKLIYKCIGYWADKKFRGKRIIF